LSPGGHDLDDQRRAVYSVNFNTPEKDGNSVLKNSTLRPSPRRKKSFTFHSLLIDVKLKAVEMATTIVFFVWLYREVIHTIAK
jgi:hypothetical protein